MGFFFFPYSSGFQILFSQLEESKANCDSNSGIPNVLASPVPDVWFKCVLSHNEVRTYQSIMKSDVSCVCILGLTDIKAMQQSIAVQDIGWKTLNEPIM